MSDYIEKLNSLLSHYQLHYQNLRSLHWNIKGPQFFELHLKYEEWYNRTLIIIDDIAERILATGNQPLSKFSDYLKRSSIQEIKPIISDGQTGMKYVQESESIILKLEKELLELSGEMEDEGTNALMSDLIREREKNMWMVKSWLNA